ncbi:MAG: VCBS repeat-containing protein [Clostridiales bacterium]|nr:VCBS repeat-containing protein [Clostridiales bacterium]
MLAVVLTGCNILGMDVENKLRPPRAAGEQAEIQKALDSYLHAEKLSSHYMLKYPRSGEYRSAFIMKDINGDQEDEALALYLPGEKAGAVHLNLLQRVEGKWTSVSDVEGISTDIDSIAFGDLDGDGRLEIFSGWNIYTDTQQLVVYSLSEGRLVQRYAETNYNKLIVGDIRKTGRDDILLLRVQPDGMSVVARLLAEQEGIITEVSSAELNIAVQRLGGARVSSLTETVSGVFIDGITASEGMVTELLCWDEQKRLTPAGITALTFREVPVPSMDIDGDGRVEWPRTVIVSPTDAAENGALPSGGPAYVHWLDWDYEKAASVAKEYGFVNLTDGYMFRTEKAWDGLISTEYDRESHTTDFYRTEGEEREWFLSIRTFFNGQSRPEENSWNFGASTFVGTVIGNVQYECALAANPPFSLNREDLLRRIKALPV